MFAQPPARVGGRHWPEEVPEEGRSKGAEQKRQPGSIRKHTVCYKKSDFKTHALSLDLFHLKPHALPIQNVLTRQKTGDEAGEELMIFRGGGGSRLFCCVNSENTRLNYAAVAKVSVNQD